VNGTARVSFILLLVLVEDKDNKLVQETGLYEYEFLEIIEFQQEHTGHIVLVR
jgi:hypothetical protein